MPTLQKRRVSLLFFLSFLRLSFGIPFFFSTRESSLRLPSSLSRQINRSNLTNYRILLSGPLPTDEVSSSPFFSFPSTSSSFHPRNQKRSPPEQFYPFVGKRPGSSPKTRRQPSPPFLPRSLVLFAHASFFHPVRRGSTTLLLVLSVIPDAG